MADRGQAFLKKDYKRNFTQGINNQMIAWEGKGSQTHFPVI